MLINRDYMTVMRAGARIERARYRKEIESGLIIGWCMAGAAAIIVLAVIL